MCKYKLAFQLYCRKYSQSWNYQFSSWKIRKRNLTMLLVDGAVKKRLKNMQFNAMIKYLVYWQCRIRKRRIFRILQWNRLRDDANARAFSRVLILEFSKSMEKFGEPKHERVEWSKNAITSKTRDCRSTEVRRLEKYHRLFVEGNEKLTETIQKALTFFCILTRWVDQSISEKSYSSLVEISLYIKIFKCSLIFV